MVWGREAGAERPPALGSQPVRGSMANANASSMLDWKSRSLLPRLLYIVQCRNRYRPQDNSIDWWKSYVAEFFAPNGVVRVSVKDMPVFQQPNHSIPTSLTCTEVPYEALPRLFQFKYENGVQEELLFLGNVIESPLPTGGTSIICYQARRTGVVAMRARAWRMLHAPCAMRRTWCL